jgi:hypothetical protein
VFFDLSIDFPPIAIPVMKRVRVLLVTKADCFNEGFEGKRTKPDFALNTLTQVGLIKRQNTPNVVVQKWRNNGEKAFLVNPIIKEALS